ncbi:MAG: hypothetical protein PHD81_01635 [Candidatus Nanoarchaeia archaeon]|nr:hypothetical protein [Candidatus Nanoarchaeia archaeon]MDD5587790.1 hypothetical protein [Candidatus Nanoarchaeia archaeon]
MTGYHLREGQSLTLEQRKELAEQISQLEQEFVKCGELMSQSKIDREYLDREIEELKHRQRITYL